MKSKIIALIVLLLITVNNTHAKNDPPISQSLLFGVDLAGHFSTNNLPQLFKLHEDISGAREVYGLIRNQLPDPSLSTLPTPSTAVNDALDAMSVLDDYIEDATKKIQNGKVVNISGDISISKLINRISLGINVVGNIYSTYDILKKTMAGQASTTDKENYILNGTFSVIGLTALLQTPPVASGVVFYSAGIVGLGFGALQLGASWGEYKYDISVTDIIDDQVKGTLFFLNQADELARIILEGGRNGKTMEELNMPDCVISVTNKAVSTGTESIQALETPSTPSQNFWAL